MRTHVRYRKAPPSHYKSNPKRIEYADDPYLGYPHEEAVGLPFFPSDPRSPEHEEWLEMQHRHQDYSYLLEEEKNRRMCPANVNPVCGVDGKVYSNGCKALNAGTRSSSDLIFDHKTRTCIPKDALAEGEGTSVDIPASTPTGSNTWMYVGIAAGVLLVGGGSYLYMKKKKAQGLA